MNNGYGKVREIMGLSEGTLMSENGDSHRSIWYGEDDFHVLPGRIYNGVTKFYCGKTTLIESDKVYKWLRSRQPIIVKNGNIGVLKRKLESLRGDVDART